MLEIISNLSNKGINKAVNDVLNSPRFINAAKKEKAQGHDGNLLTQFIDVINKLLERILKKYNVQPPSIFDSLFGPGNWFAYLIETIILVLILGIIIFLIVKFLIKREKIKLKQNDNAQIIDVNADYYTLAQEASSKLDIKAAIRFMFLGILVNLSKLDLLRIDEGKTNYQYYLELKKNKTARYNAKNFIGDFKSSIFIFNEIWYGKKQADLQKYNICKNFYEEVADALGRKAK